MENQMEAGVIQGLMTLGPPPTYSDLQGFMVTMLGTSSVPIVHHYDWVGVINLCT